MVYAKLFKVRDKGDVVIPCAAVKLSADTSSERELLSDILPDKTDGPLVFLLPLNGKSRNRAVCDPAVWSRNDGRSLPAAHDYIIQNFDTLRSGSQVDVESIVGG